MEKTINKLLTDAVRPAELLEQIASAFYEAIDQNRSTHRILYLMLNEYDTFQEYFSASRDELTAQEREILADIQENFVYQVETYFDDREDKVMEGLLSGNRASEILLDMKQQGVLPMEGELHADDVELFYADAFEEFDRLHMRFMEKLMTLSPQKAFAQGEQAAEEYRRKHHILFDEKDFIEAYQQSFSKEALWKLLRERLQQTLRYGRHYVLCWDEEEQVEEEGEDGTAEKEEESGVLEGRGDLAAEMFDYVYELMQEYTGRRVLPSENQWGDQAYWTTYQDDFQEILGYFILDHLEATIQKLDQERPREYESFGRLFGLSAAERTDPEQILNHCDRINYYLTQLNEKLWDEFTETKIKDLL